MTMLFEIGAAAIMAAAFLAALIDDMEKPPLPRQWQRPPDD